MPPRSEQPALYLVRHGETEGQSSIRYYGRTDIALSHEGRTQMRAARDALAARLGEVRFSHVFASPLIRALEGARLIAGMHAPIRTLDEFIEVDFGLFEGLTADEIRERYPDDFARWNADRLAPGFTYPGGESRAAFAARVERGVDRMLEAWRGGGDAPEGLALVVAHRGVIRAIVRRLAGAEPHVELASIHVLEHAGGWRVREIDYVAHLQRG
jgi:broad specificity phosphatase PhoE